MKLIPLLLTLGMLAVSGWAQDAKPEDNLWERSFIQHNEPYDPELVKKAEAGDAAAQTSLGVMYAEGYKPFPQDYKVAVKWFTKSAKQNNVEAQISLGFCYYKGKGVTKDYKEAVKWITKSAEQGNMEAQIVLGTCYFKGIGVTQDGKEAAKWRAKAAEQKEANAKEQLEKLKSK